MSVTFLKAPKLTKEDKKSVTTMLDAAGEVLVVRAMTNTCKPKYVNDGWDNCWFTQMFGGKANLNRMTEAYSDRIGFPGTMDYDAAVADKLGIEESVVNDVIGIFDDGSYNPAKRQANDWGYDYEIDTSKVKQGKVLSFLNFVDEWLAARGIVLSLSFDAHKVPKNNY